MSEINNLTYTQVGSMENIVLFAEICRDLTEKQRTIAFFFQIRVQFSNIFASRKSYGKLDVSISLQKYTY